MDVTKYIVKDYITNLLKEGRRVDGRKYDEARPIEVVKGYAKEKSSGSALVKLGDTQVIAGISVGLGEPYSDRPTSGIMTTSAELRPIASPDFELGPPRENSVELARVVDRGIRESGCIDVDKLFIEENKVWTVFIDLHMMDNHGNLIDASALAAMAALLDARMPKLEDGKIISGEWDGKLPITCTPIPLTFAKIADTIIADPNMQEEYALDARLTITTTEKEVNAMQKGGEGRFTIAEAEDLIDKAFKSAKQVRKKIES
ncbi:MAG TPA: exosome complex protein Rrp42 [Candidatus Altiarchaeales archaeon]|nr:exosome complex protein Rrp42 [Candidatus Altiarchaeales archaeon]